MTEPTKPRISIIIPAYNRRAFVAQSISSVKQQTFHAWELIVVDDGSTDDTYSEAIKAAESDPRITIVRSENGGVSLARRIGFNRADFNAEYVAFLDSDDVWLPNLLENLVSELDARPYAVASYGTYESVDQDMKPIPEYYDPPDTKDTAFVGAADFLESFYSAFPSVTVIRRWAYEASGGFDPFFTKCEDHDLWLRLCHFGLFIFKNIRVACRRYHKTNLHRDPVRDEIGIAFGQRCSSYTHALLKARGVSAFIVSESHTPELTASLKRAEEHGIFPRVLGLGCTWDKVARLSMQMNALRAENYNQLALLFQPGLEIAAGPAEISELFKARNAKIVFSGDTFVLGRAGAILDLYERLGKAYLERTTDSEVNFFLWVSNNYDGLIREDLDDSLLGSLIN